MLFLQYGRGNTAGAHQNKAQSPIARVLPAEKGQSHQGTAAHIVNKTTAVLPRLGMMMACRFVHRSMPAADNQCMQASHAKPWSVYLVEAVLPQDLHSIIPQRRDGIRLNVI